ncbi:MAG TPA: site-specific integrase [Thermoanaerobaculia bacterium]|nr:site-specific integrase [Thermoanaerobaculia bacterium]
MATIQQYRGRNGGVSWRALVRRKGHPPQTATFARKTDALDWAQQLEAAMRAGRAFVGTEARRRTFAELAARYREDVMPHYEAVEQRKREARLRWWEERLGHARLADITPNTIAECKSRLARGGKGLTPSGRPASPATQVRYLATVSHLLSHAVRELGWLDSNPAQKVRRPREPRGRVRFLSDEERVRLLEACRASSERSLYLLVMFALATGARQGELLRLRWADIDLQRRTAVIHKTKNGERRTLALSAPVLDALRESGSLRFGGSDLVFAGRRTIGFPRKAWQTAVKNAEVADFTFHDLRHAFASYLAMSGATLAELAAALGHKTLAMVQRYAHLSEQHTSGIVNRMAERFLI